MANPTTNLGMALPTEQTALKTDMYNAALQILDALFGAGVGAAWSSWTVTWVNLTVGNGTVTAKYARIGKLIFARVTIVFGSTTSVSGDISASLPVTSAAYAGTAGNHGIGIARAFDVSASTTYEGVMAIVTTTTAKPRFWVASGTYVTATNPSSTVPFTWTNPDELTMQFAYEAA